MLCVLHFQWLFPLKGPFSIFFHRYLIIFIFPALNIAYVVLQHKSCVVCQFFVFSCIYLIYLFQCDCGSDFLEWISWCMKRYTVLIYVYVFFQIAPHTLFWLGTDSGCCGTVWRSHLMWMMPWAVMRLKDRRPYLWPLMVPPKFINDLLCLFAC